MPKDDDFSSARVADALDRIADTLQALMNAWQEREKKFAERASKPRTGGFGAKRDFGDRGPPRGGDRPPFKKRFDRDDDRGPPRRRDDDRAPARSRDDDDFKKRGPRSTFRDFDAPKNFGNKKPAGAKKFGAKKKF